MIVAALILASVSLLATALLFVQAAARTDTAIRAYAEHRAQVVNDQSRERAIDVCNRSNAPRAYLRLRAREFVKTDALTQSYTTRISPWVLSILNCEQTVAAHGLPIPLSHAVQAAYLRMFANGIVANVVDGRIAGGRTFAQYFRSTP